jgi:hypothetical protein
MSGIFNGSVLGNLQGMGATVQPHCFDSPKFVEEYNKCNAKYTTENCDADDPEYYQCTQKVKYWRNWCIDLATEHCPPIGLQEQTYEKYEEDDDEATPAKPPPSRPPSRPPAKKQQQPPTTILDPFQKIAQAWTSFAQRGGGVTPDEPAPPPPKEDVTKIPTSFFDLRKILDTAPPLVPSPVPSPLPSPEKRKEVKEPQKTDKTAIILLGITAFLGITTIGILVMRDK